MRSGQTTRYPILEHGVKTIVYLGVETICLLKEHGDLVAPANGEVGPSTGVKFHSQYIFNQASIPGLGGEFWRVCSPEILRRAS